MHGRAVGSPVDAAALISEHLSAPAIVLRRLPPHLPAVSLFIYRKTILWLLEPVTHSNSGVRRSARDRQNFDDAHPVKEIPAQDPPPPPDSRLTVTDSLLVHSLAHHHHATILPHHEPSL